MSDNYYKNLTEKWAPVLNEETAGTIQDSYRKSVTAVVLENQEKALAEQRQQTAGFLSEAPGTTTGSIGTWDPILISLVRRAMPNRLDLRNEVTLRQRSNIKHRSSVQRSKHSMGR